MSLVNKSNIYELLKIVLDSPELKPTKEDVEIKKKKKTKQKQLKEFI